MGGLAVRACRAGRSLTVRSPTLFAILRPRARSPAADSNNVPLRCNTASEAISPIHPFKKRRYGHADLANHPTGTAGSLQHPRRVRQQLGRRGDLRQGSVADRCHQLDPHRRDLARIRRLWRLGQEEHVREPDRSDDRSTRTASCGNQAGDGNRPARRVHRVGHVVRHQRQLGGRHEAQEHVHGPHPRFRRHEPRGLRHGRRCDHGR